MRISRLLVAAPTIVAIAFFATVVGFAFTTTVPVYPGHLEGWVPRAVAGSQPTPAATPAVLFVVGPGTPPLSRGSVEFAVGSDGTAGAEMRQSGFPNTALPSPTPTPDPDLPPPIAQPDELSALRYDTYVLKGSC